jgi:hypothetical protein
MTNATCCSDHYPSDGTSRPSGSAARPGRSPNELVVEGIDDAEATVPANRLPAVSTLARF